ncbi:MAG: HlyC/CorC family transporter [Anaerolineae bacterium]|nr:HlyC/CorC family transporter [Anaerolineae bacterium]
MEPPLPGLVGLFLLLLMGTFFAASQSAFVNARRHLLRDQSERGDRRAQLALKVAEDSTRVLATFQLANLLTHFLVAGLLIIIFLAPLASLIESTMPGLASASTLLAYLIGIPASAFLFFLLTVVLPTTLAQGNAEYWAMLLAGPAQLTIALFSPLVAISSRVRRGVAVQQSSGIDGTLVTEEEIMTLVDVGEEGGAIEQEEKEMIYSIFRLDETLAREIMLPRIDIVALDINTPLDQAIEVITQAGHSRIPVYEESLDHIKGLLYAKDLLTVRDEGKSTVELKTLLRPASFVPETKGVLDLLRELQSTKVHLTVVIDEYGGTAGLVTIEDIVEEIVGEIMDEYDLAEEAPYELIGEGKYIFDARVGLDNFNHILNANLPDELADTLGGFIYGRLGKVPTVGETVETEQLCLKVTEIIDQRIRKVQVTRLSPGDDSPKNANGHAQQKEG